LKEVREAVNSHESEVSFFDSVDHELMREKIRRYIGDPTLRVLIEGWLSAEVWTVRRLRVTKQGFLRALLFRPSSPISFSTSLMRRC